MAALLTGCDALLRTTPTVAVLAVDMPRLNAHTLRRLLDAAAGTDGAVLVDPSGRRQLAFVVDRARLEAVRPDHEAQHGMALRELLGGLDLAEVAALGEEHRDVDTWSDLRDIQETLRSRGPGSGLRAGDSEQSGQREPPRLDRRAV